jgi:hypothetical protein
LKAHLRPKKCKKGGLKTQARWFTGPKKAANKGRMNIAGWRLGGGL